MTIPGTVRNAMGALGSVSPAHMRERVDSHAPEYLSNFMDSLVQPVPVAFVYVLLIAVPLIAGLVRALRPLLESWIMGRSVRLRTAGGLSYTQRNIIVRLPPLAFVEVPNYNILLQNAVLVYVCHRLWRQKPLPSHFLFRHAQTVMLLDPYRVRMAFMHDLSPFYLGSLGYSDKDSSTTFKEKLLERLRLIKLPHNSWIPVMSDNIELYFTEESISVPNYSELWTCRTVSLRCPAMRGAAAKLDRFVQRALEVFAEGAPNREEDTLRWFFTYGGESDGKVLFNQYVLRSNKGFDTLFFPQRDATLTLINQFMQHRGRFAVEGFPQRLGFLVYGPPGTGRHAFVKALAAHTGRHVVSVPLSKLRTNQQLYDIFFERQFKSEAEGKVQKLRVEDVIFLFDDVDAADSVVCARAARRVVQRRAAARLTARTERREAPLTNCVVEMDTSSSRPVMRLEDNELRLALMRIMAGDALGNDGELAKGCGGDRDKGGGWQTTEKTTSAAAAAASGAGAKAIGGHLSGMSNAHLGDRKDDLDLSGLLNVLDGVVDTPGRMVVMITEHPEWLDPALIRPGRFSVRLRLDYMEMEALVQMLGAYYGDVVHSQRASGSDTGCCVVDADVGGAVEAAHVGQYPAAGATAGCAVHRELSEVQVARVHEVVAALEAEAEASAAREVSTDDDSGSGESKYRFQVTPCEVEMLCIEQDDLEGFLGQLAGVVRGTVHL
ncbi:mitochondrial chaperone, putative [Leishmania tarentolae]|uniref:Mitochondrial chaperone, putative n=1 Tax=Leishmania tarentolae TaxID=5689 RepID=A0A640KGH9_LEITA|nr:mitochondrial chaperone, putative [Leishmania tarentolae]